jgi:hypothetical protein
MQRAYQICQTQRKRAGSRFEEWRDWVVVSDARTVWRETELLRDRDLEL